MAGAESLSREGLSFRYEVGGHDGDTFGEKGQAEDEHTVALEQPGSHERVKVSLGDEATHDFKVQQGFLGLLLEAGYDDEGVMRVLDGMADMKGEEQQKFIQTLRDRVASK